MTDNETRFLSIRALELLEEAAVVRDSMPPPPPLDPLPRFEFDDELDNEPLELANPIVNIDNDPAVELVPLDETQRGVINRLAEAWVLITEAREAIQQWAQNAGVEVGFTLMIAQLRQSQGMLDDVLLELEEEPSTRRTPMLPPEL